MENHGLLDHSSSWIYNPISQQANLELFEGQSSTYERRNGCDSSGSPGKLVHPPALSREEGSTYHSSEMFPNNIPRTANRYCGSAASKAEEGVTSEYVWATLYGKKRYELTVLFFGKCPEVQHQCIRCAWTITKQF